MYEQFNPGDRVELAYTNDPYTNLVPGSLGTVSPLGMRIEMGERKLHVKWDNGSTLSLLLDSGDAVRRVDA